MLVSSHNFSFILTTFFFYIFHDFNSKHFNFGLAKDAPVGVMSHVSIQVMGAQDYTTHMCPARYNSVILVTALVLNFLYAIVY